MKSYDDDNPFGYFDEYPQDDPFKEANMCSSCLARPVDVVIYKETRLCWCCYDLEMNTMAEKAKNAKD